MKYHNARQRRADRQLNDGRIYGIMWKPSSIKFRVSGKRPKLPQCHICGAAARPGWPCELCIKKLENGEVPNG